MYDLCSPIAAGTFIQCDMAASWENWEWISEFKYLKEAGMNYVVLGTSENIKTDVTEKCLENAALMGIRVFITINYSSSWFEKGSRDENWLYKQMETDSAAADKIYKRYHYKYPESFYGWYFAYEVDNMNFNSRKKFKVLSKALNILLNNLIIQGERLPLLISPFMNSYYGTAYEYAENWAYLFTHTEFGTGDIFCPQDCVGGGGLDISKVDQWFCCFRKAVNEKPGLLFWANTETFDHSNWCSAPIKRFVRQMKIESKYVDNIITFAYSHYYSPNNIDPRLHKIYLDYVKTGCLPENNPKPPKNITVEKISINKTVISWEPGESGIGIFGYELYRNGKKIFSTFLERKYGGNSSGLVLRYEDKEVYKLGLMALKPVIYEVKCIDMAGNSS